MSEIAKKYGVTDDQFNAMVKDGVISTSWPFYDEVVIHYKANLHKGKSEAVKLTAEKFNKSTVTIYNAIKAVEDGTRYKYNYYTKK